MRRYEFNLTFFKRFWKVLCIIFPRWKSVTVLLFITALCLVLLEQYVIYQVGIIPSKYYKVLGDKDLSEFRNVTLIASLVIISMAFIRSTKKYVCSVFYVMTRGLLSKHLHTGYFTDIIYYHINVLDKSVDNPDQRITQDVDKLCKTFSEIITDLLVSPFAIAYYTYNTWTSTGYVGPLVVILFFAVSTFVNKFLMSTVVDLVVKQEHLEGDFRFSHMQMRSNCESAAFYRCGAFELKKTNKKLDRLLRTQQQLNLRQYALQFSVHLADYFGSILSYVMVAIPIFSGVFDDKTPAELSSLISKNAFVTIYLIYCFTRLIDMALQVSEMAGTTHRIIQLDERQSELKSKHSNSMNGINNGCDSDCRRKTEILAYRLDNVTLAPPNRDDKYLVNGLCMELKSGVNVLVTGDSGCGKSSLLRALDDLWPHLKGIISRNVVHGSRGVMYLPQKPYLTDGTLREQIVFPYVITDDIIMGDDEHVTELLSLAGLGDLLERTGGLDTTTSWNWYDMLSPGEMQRLSFVRLLYHRPPFAVLDEATSQIGLSMERTLYTACKDSNITLLSVGHRDSLRQYHHAELRLQGDGTWRLTAITSDDGEPEEPNIEYLNSF